MPRIDTDGQLDRQQLTMELSSIESKLRTVTWKKTVVGFPGLVQSIRLIGIGFFYLMEKMRRIKYLPFLAVPSCRRIAGRWAKCHSTGAVCRSADKDVLDVVRQRKATMMDSWLVRSRVAGHYRPCLPVQARNPPGTGRYNWNCHFRHCHGHDRKRLSHQLDANGIINLADLAH